LPKRPAPLSLEDDIAYSKSLTPGSDTHHRAYVGPPGEFDFMGATQFRLLTSLGLREEHYLLDVGCGSLRAGKYLLQYLLPGRYIGLEPNGWLWQEAFKQEVGEDVQRLKRPTFLDSEDFSLAEDCTPAKDFIVAQSIYTHTGEDLFAHSVQLMAQALAPTGQFLFNAVVPNDPIYANVPAGKDHSGWIYPGCVSFEEMEIIRVCQNAGLSVQKLPWFHPRVSWFRAVNDPDLLLTNDMLNQLGTGRPLFDERF